MIDGERLQRVRSVLNQITAEASAFTEYSTYTDDAFRRIVLLAKDAYENTVPEKATR